VRNASTLEHLANATFRFVAAASDARLTAAGAQQSLAGMRAI
jgi:hypothetical protein